MLYSESQAHIYRPPTRFGPAVTKRSTFCATNWPFKTDYDTGGTTGRVVQTATSRTGGKDVHVVVCLRALIVRCLSVETDACQSGHSRAIDRKDL